MVGVVSARVDKVDGDGVTAESVLPASVYCGLAVVTVPGTATDAAVVAVLARGAFTVIIH
jgi:hypothetical protein